MGAYVTDYDSRGVSIGGHWDDSIGIGAADMSVQANRVAFDAQLKVIMRNSGVSEEEAAAVSDRMPANGSPHPTKAGYFYSVNTQRFEPQATPAGLKTAAEVLAWVAATPGAAAANAAFNEAIRSDGRTDAQVAGQVAAFNELMGGGAKQLIAAAPIVASENYKILRALGTSVTGANIEETMIKNGAGSGLFTVAAGLQPAGGQAGSSAPLTVAAAIAALLWIL